MHLANYNHKLCYTAAGDAFSDAYKPKSDLMYSTDLILVN